MVDQTTLSALRSSRATGVAVFRAGFVCLLGAVLAFIYLNLVSTAASAILFLVLSIIMVLGCFVLGLMIYSRAVKQLNTYGEPSNGVLRKQNYSVSAGFSKHASKAKLTPDEEEKWRTISNQFGE